MHSLVNMSDQNAAGPRWQQLLTETGLLETVEQAVRSLNKPAETGQASKAAYIEQCLQALLPPDQVVEVRILGIQGRKRTDSGYFNNVSALAKAVVAYDGKAEGIYFTLNPVNPALIARANNRIREYADHTTSDADIVKRVLLPIDFDAVRPAGISSTDAEHEAAIHRAVVCAAWLAHQGWPEPVLADSGNGAHLLYAVDLPNDSRSTDLVKHSLETLAFLFGDGAVSIDTSVGNASRIFKLYGTLACKGDNTPHRPHRRAIILSAPSQRTALTMQQLEQLAIHLPKPEKKAVDKPQLLAGNKPSAYGRAALEQEIATLSRTQTHRNDQLFQSSAALFGLVASGALERNDVWQALSNAAKTIGLPELEARRTIASGERNGMQSPRVIPHATGKASSPAPVTSAPTTQTPESPSTSETKRHLLHVDELDTLPPITWLIQDILPANSLVEMHGAPGVGKTQVMFDMAQTLAANGRTVVYVVAEGLQGYRARKRAWQKFRQQPGGNLFIWQDAVQLFEPQAVRTFIQAIHSKQPALVVFDTLSRCSLGADENSQKDMGFILESLDKVRRETGAAVAVVHHMNAAGSRERGSSVIRGGMDVMIEVSQDDDLIVVTSSKMKDAEKFYSVYLKPVMVDIGEGKSVPVLIPAERRIQTQADKLTPLQFEILKAVGMDMFAESGIKSSQLDEILPGDTKRASKYYGLNMLIRLGYVKPHIKGDPYHITEVGREKLSKAESGTLTGKSNMSKPSPTLSIWTLPDSCPMSSPNPHTSGCGLDKTLDKPEDNGSTEPAASIIQPAVPSEMPQDTPRSNVIEAYMLPGLVGSDNLLTGYKQACAAGEGSVFKQELQRRNPKAAEALEMMLSGKRGPISVLVPTEPTNP